MDCIKAPRARHFTSILFVHHCTNQAQKTKQTTEKHLKIERSNMQDATAGGFISPCTDQTNSCLMNFIKSYQIKTKSTSLLLEVDTAPYLFSDTK